MNWLVSLLADDTLFIIMGVSAVLLLSGVTRRNIVRDYSYAAMAGITSLLIGKLASMLYQPAAARPFMELGQQPGATFINNPGFPSDHMLFASVIVLAVYALTPYRKTAHLLAALTIAMGVSRVLALVHTPLDIFGGIAAALLGGVWYMSRRRQFGRSFKGTNR